jgi:hypothetical protein
VSPPETFEYGAKVIERITKCKGGNANPNRMKIFIGKKTSKPNGSSVNN